MHELLQPYILLVDFLADAFGENTEVVLHDLQDLEKSVVAIRNGHISGRKVGSPTTDLSLDVMKSASFKQEPYITGYEGVTKNGHKLRSSTWFIKDSSGELVGMLCINRDFHALLDIQRQLDSVVAAFGMTTGGPIRESFSLNVRELVDTNLQRVQPDLEEQLEKMGQKEKQKIVETLGEMGTFLVKGAVGYVAERLGVSQATVYRYLDKKKA